MGSATGNPRTKRSVRPLKSSKNSFRTLKDGDPSSIAIEVIPLSSKALSEIAVTEAGRTKRNNDRQE
jgi:hypothetical protein